MMDSNFGKETMIYKAFITSVCMDMPTSLFYWHFLNSNTSTSVTKILGVSKTSPIMIFFVMHFTGKKHKIELQLQGFTPDSNLENDLWSVYN